MRIKNLSANPKNPRTVTPEKLAQLKDALLEFGDLSGIIYNRKSKQLVGGHQRVKNFDKDADVTLTKEYAKPTKTGTVAEGYVELDGERFSYREVSWDRHREMAANLAANKNAGTWDMPELAEWMKELNSFDVELDLNLTMFDDQEFHSVKEHLRVNPNSFEPGSEDDQGQLDQKKPIETQCPKCGECFDANKNKPQN